MTIFIDFAVDENCENMYDSYGMICVHCNCCGRFNKDTAKEAQINMWKERLQSEKDFDKWATLPELRERQKRVVAENIDYAIQKLRKLGVEDL